MTSTPELPWTFERIARCEDQIWAVANNLVNREIDVVFDLGLQKITDREKLREQCLEQDIPLKLYYLDASKEVRRNRVLKRNQGDKDTFSFIVSPEIFEMTDQMFEVPNTEDHLIVAS